jgi:non-heme chloroperoxidase
MLAAMPALAQSIVGDWQGTLAAGKQKLRVIVKVSTSADGQLSATLFSIDQGVDGIPVETFTLTGSAVDFAIPAIKGSYAGTLSADGATIAGTWTQGDSTSLSFARATKETAWSLDSTPHTIQFIEVEPGVKLEVLDWGGAGMPVVLLAGLGNNAHVFDKFAPKLTSKYHVYGITRRGFGASDSPTPTNDNYSADRLGDDVLAVLDALKISRPVLIGHSIAGEELSSIGSRHPERVAGLVYLDAGYPYAFYNKARPDFEVDVAQLRRDLNATINAYAPQDEKKLIAKLQEELPVFEKDLEARQKDFATQPDMSDADLAKAKQEASSRQSISSDAVINSVQPYTDIKCPVLAIFALPHQQGRKPDPAIDAKDMEKNEPQIKAFQAGIPQAKVVIIAHANHYLFLSNETKVMGDIDEFIAGLK